MAKGCREEGTRTIFRQFPIQLSFIGKIVTNFYYHCI